jgi:UDP-2-acetamido-3-amino-2,3-dideoxy-glucuronate N-acetyltransferase
MKLHSNYKTHNIYKHFDIYKSDFAWIDGNVEVGEGTRIYHFTVIRENVKIGKNSIIGHNVVVERDTVIGDRTTIQSQCHITAEAVIGNDCFFGPGVVTMNERNIANNGRAIPKIEVLRIGNGVRIGAGAIIAPGIQIGDNAFIHAASFVTKSVGEGEIWGNLRGESRASRLGMVPMEERL